VNSNAAPTDQDRDELLLLYDVSVKDIAFFKKQQWVATNYGIALYVAVIAISSHILKNLTLAHKVVLFLSSLGIMLAGIGVLCHLQHSIVVRRARLRAVREHFGQPFHAAWGAIPKEDNALHILLLAVLIIGFIVNAWLITLEL
jgi:hypothetical protein